MANPENLQNQIDGTLRLLGDEVIKEIKLAPWSDVSDLTMNVDLDVIVNDLPRREFSIMSLQCVNDFLSGERMNAIVTGNPLIIVDRITGDLVVRGILRYIELEGRDKLSGNLA